jgi:hypothetical protein
MGLQIYYRPTMSTHIMILYGDTATQPAYALIGLPDLQLDYKPFVCLFLVIT